MRPSIIDKQNKCVPRPIYFGGIPYVIPVSMPAKLWKELTNYFPNPTKILVNEWLRRRECRSKKQFLSKYPFVTKDFVKIINYLSNSHDTEMVNEKNTRKLLRNELILNGGGATKEFTNIAEYILSVARKNLLKPKRKPKKQ